MNFSLKFLVKSLSFFTYIKVFNYDSFNLNQTSLIRSNGVELNPGPKKSFSLTFFHWNLNGIAAHDFAKIFLIQPRPATRHFSGQGRFREIGALR